MKVAEAAEPQAVAAKPAEPFKQVLAQAKPPQGAPKAPAAAAKTPLAAVGAKAGPKPKVQLPAARPAQPLPARATSPAGRSPAAQAALARGLAHEAQARVTQQARARVTSEASRLVAVRAEHAEAAQAAEVRSTQLEAPKERIDERMLKLICRELSGDERGAPRTAANAAHGQPTGLGQTPVSDAKDAAKARGEQAVALIEKIEVFVKSQRPALALTLNNSLGARVEIERLGPGEVGLRLVGRNGPPTPDTLARIREELGARGLKVKALSVS